jgi:3-hydroxybutyryl-CoA dehydrogenase
MSSRRALGFMHVCVLGAGTMGQGIAQVSAMAGHQVRLRDVEMKLVEEGIDAIEATLTGGVERDKVTLAEREATLDHIEATTDLESAAENADLVIEAVPEDLDLKQDVLDEASRYTHSDAILASNTSSLSVTGIASGISDPERVIGLHFFNPVHLMELVEIVLGERTAEPTLSAAREFVDDIGKTSVEIADTPGFASSRLGIALGLEAMRMVEGGVAGPRDIDRVMELGYNYPMGPIELGDIVGLDVRLDIATYLREELGERFRPPQILKRKVRAGKLGKKSGEGFYEWEDGEVVGVSGEYR